MKLITEVEDFNKKYKITTQKVAKFLIKKLKPKQNQTIVEIGCGDGALTIPIAKKLKKCRIIAVDNEKKALDELKKKINKLRLKNIEVINSSATDLKEISNEQVDYLISHWLLGVITKAKDLRKMFLEFYRVLKRGGKMAHSESYPHPKNKAQELYMKADTFIMNTKWWDPKDYKRLMKIIGFKNIKIKLLEFDIKVKPVTAFNLFHFWERTFTSFIPKEKFSTGKADKFIQKYGKLVRKHGIKFPTEYVIFAIK